MQVYKFGGGIIRDATAIEKLRDFLVQNKNDKVILVLSAIDKTTNKLEKLISEFLHEKSQFYKSFNQIKQFHHGLINALNFNNSGAVEKNIHDLFDELNAKFNDYKQQEFDFLYDQLVCFGELISSKLISCYLTDQEIDNNWFDIRAYLKTSDLYRNAEVKEDVSKGLLNQYIQENTSRLYITQGFIGSSEQGHSTTLGREGSDYTAALIGNFTHAEKVVLWKDVKGIYNADPKNYEKAILIPELSYDDALELTKLGSKVLHYKSINPLKELNIPLEVKLFDLAVESGSRICSEAHPIKHIPIIVHRFNKYVLKIKSTPKKGFSKKDEQYILDSISDTRLVINFHVTKGSVKYVCLNNFPELILRIMVQLSKYYHIEVFDQVCMIKVKNGRQEIIDHLSEGKDLLISELHDHIHYLFYT